jgi:hypothetical protein
MLNWPSMHVGGVSDVGIDWTLALEDGDTVVSVAAEVRGGAVVVLADDRAEAIHSLRLSAVRAGVAIVVVTAITMLGETLKDDVRLIVVP